VNGEQQIKPQRDADDTGRRPPMIMSLLDGFLAGTVE